MICGLYLPLFHSVRFLIRCSPCMIYPRRLSSIAWCLEVFIYPMIVFLLRRVWTRHFFLSRVGLKWAPTIPESFLNFCLSSANFAAQCILISVIFFNFTHPRCPRISSSSGTFNLSLQYCLCYLFIVHAKHMSNPFVLSSIDYLY